MRKLLDLFRYLISIACITALFIFLYVVLSKTFVSENIDEGDGFHNLPDNSMDVIVLGSSHSQYSFSPLFFYQDTGLYSYVLGTPCQPLDVSYLMLKEALKTQSPKVVVLEVFTSMPLKKTCDDGVTCYITSGYQMRGNEKYEALKKLPQDKYDVYVNPFISSHNEWRTTEINIDEIKEKILNTITGLKKRNEKDYSKISRLFGYLDNYPSFPVENSWYPNTTNSFLDVELESKDITSLNNINELCKENNIELILYKTPIDSLDIENLSYLNKVWEWADVNGVQYIDFIKKAEEIDFQMWIQSDSYHSYINGASLITSNIAEDIRNKNYEHKFNDYLENKYSDVACGQTISYIKNEYDPSKYLKRLANYSGPMLIIYSGENKNDDTLNKFLNKFNIISSDIVFVDNSQVIDRSDACVGLEYKEKNIYSDYSYTEIDGNVYENDCGLIIYLFSLDMNSCYKLDTNLGTMWKNGYHWYGE